MLNLLLLPLTNDPIPNVLKYKGEKKNINKGDK